MWAESRIDAVRHIIPNNSYYTMFTKRVQNQRLVYTRQLHQSYEKVRRIWSEHWSRIARRRTSTVLVPYLLFQRISSLLKYIITAYFQYHMLAAIIATSFDYVDSSYQSHRLVHNYCIYISLLVTHTLLVSMMNNASNKETYDTVEDRRCMHDCP